MRCAAKHRGTLRFARERARRANGESRESGLLAKTFSNRHVFGASTFFFIVGDLRSGAGTLFKLTLVRGPRVRQDTLEQEQKHAVFPTGAHR